MKEKEEKSRQELNLEQWLDLLRSCSIYHRKKARDTTPTIIGQEPSEEHVLHKVWVVSINEAVDLISMLPRVEPEEVDDSKLPQHKKGPLG